MLHTSVRTLQSLLKTQCSWTLISNLEAIGIHLLGDFLLEYRYVDTHKEASSYDSHIFKLNNLLGWVSNYVSARTLAIFPILCFILRKGLYTFARCSATGGLSSLELAIQLQLCVLSERNLFMCKLLSCVFGPKKDEVNNNKTGEEIAWKLDAWRTEEMSGKYWNKFQVSRFLGCELDETGSVTF